MDSRQWSRGELKERSRAVLHLHYWRIVFVSVLLSMLVGSDGAVSTMFETVTDNVMGTRPTVVRVRGGDEVVETYFEEDMQENVVFSEESAAGMALLATLFFSVLAFGGIVLISIFVINPIYVGTMRFYVRSFDKEPKFKDIVYALDNRYKNIVTIMFLRDLYTLLWCLLFIIPGIVKGYEYRMVPYLLAENPDLEVRAVFYQSKEMMRGQKWRAFVLDISFLGWYLLAVTTFGILAIMYVTPYKNLTQAALYRRLRGTDGPVQNIYYEGMPIQDGGNTDGLSNFDCG